MTSVATVASKSQIVQKAWEDPQFKAQLLANPKSALKDAFGIELPEGMEVRALEETPSSYYLVIPPSPSDLKREAKSAEYVWS